MSASDPRVSGNYKKSGAHPTAGGRALETDVDAVEPWVRDAAVRDRIVLGMAQPWEVIAGARCEGLVQTQNRGQGQQDNEQQRELTELDLHSALLLQGAGPF